MLLLVPRLEWKRSDCTASLFGAVHNACEFKSDRCAQAHFHTEGSVCKTADALSCSFAVFHSRSMFAVFVHGCVCSAWNDCIEYVRVTTWIRFAAAAPVRVWIVVDCLLLRVCLCLCFHISLILPCVSVWKCNMLAFHVHCSCGLCAAICVTLCIWYVVCVHAFSVSADCASSTVHNFVYSCGGVVDLHDCFSGCMFFFAFMHQVRWCPLFVVSNPVAWQLDSCLKVWKSSSVLVEWGMVQV